MNKIQNCFIGAVMIQFAQALVMTWGKCNIYYFSYYKHFQSDLDFNLNTIVIFYMAIPLGILSAFSMRIAQKVTHVLLIRICCTVQFISLAIAPFMPTYQTFIFFFLVLNGFTTALLNYPLLGCVYSYYSKNEGRITGILIGIFTFANLIFVLIVTFLSNPNNHEADLDIIIGQQSFKYFSYEEVGFNVQFAAIFAGLLAGCFSIIGSFLISFNIDASLEQKQFEKKNSQIFIEMEDFEFSHSSLKQPVLPEALNQSKVTISIIESITTKAFIIMLLAQFSQVFFSVTLGLNLKSYALSKINDDYFITYVDTVSLILSGVISFYWGRLADSQKFVEYFTIIYLLDGFFVILLALTKGAFFFCLFYICIALVDKGAMVLIGPGLVKIFGTEIGTELLAILNSASLISFILAPLCQIYAVHYVSFDFVLAYCGLLLIFAGILNTQLKINDSL